MGRAAAGEISRSLIAAGRDPETPVMVAVNVSLPNERLIRGKLSALAFLVATISDEDPTLLLIGEAVAGTHLPVEVVERSEWRRVGKEGVSTGSSRGGA